MLAKIFMALGTWSQFLLLETQRILEKVPPSKSAWEETIT